MPEPGWYPDPGGRSGHYRFWDGQHWGLTTTPDLPGGSPAGDGPRPPRPSRGTRWVVAATAAAVVLVLVAVGALVLRDRTRPTAGPSPQPSTSAPAEAPSTSAPPPTATPSATPVPGPEATPTPAPSTAQTPGASPSAGAGPCLFGSPFSRQDYPRDGRVHGGNLSFARPQGWVYPGRQTDSFTWAYDVGEADVQVQQQSYAAYAVGAVSVADGFEDPRSAAELTMTCTLASPLYGGAASRTDVTSEETTVDGYRAWTLRSELRDDRTPSGGDTVVVTVVDLDSPEALAFFWGSAPLGDAGLTDQLERTADRLTVG